MHSHTHNHSDSHAQDHDYHGHGSIDFQNVNVSFLIAVAANLGFTCVEAAYGFITNSVSLLGDAGHNLSDVLGLLLAWGASYLATKKTGDTYSFGFRRTTILAAMINAVVLVFVAGFIAYESFEKLFHPTSIAVGPVMIVATIGIFINAGTAILFVRRGKQDLNIRGAYLHLVYDAVISAGVVVTAVVIYYTDWLWVDSVAGLIIVLVILGGTWGLLKDSVNLILDAVPQGIERASVKEFLELIEGVTEVHDLHIWAMSTHENCLTAHLVMPQNTLWDSEDGYADISRLLRENFNIHHITLQIEKDPDCPNNDCD